MENDTRYRQVPESKNKSLFREVLAAVKRHIKGLYKPFEKGDSTLDKIKKVLMGVLSTLVLIMVSPVVLFILVVTILVAL